MRLWSSRRVSASVAVFWGWLWGVGVVRSALLLVALICRCRASLHKVMVFGLWAARSGSGFVLECGPTGTTAASPHEGCSTRWSGPAALTAPVVAVSGTGAAHFNNGGV